MNALLIKQFSFKKYRTMYVQFSKVAFLYGMW